MSVILVVEQDEAYAHRIASVLRSAGHPVDMIPNIEDALQRSGAPRLTFVSGTLPGAPQLLDRFSKKQGGPGSVVVLPVSMAGQTAPGQYRADRLLPKPFSDEELLKIVSHLLPDTPSPDGAHGGQLTSAEIFGDVLAEVEAEAQATETRRRRPRKKHSDIDRKLEETLSGFFPDKLKGAAQAEAPKPAPAVKPKRRRDVPSADEIEDLLDKTLSSLELPARAKRAKAAPEPTPRPPVAPSAAPPPRPDAARPDAARPDAARPDAARPDAARPDAARPTPPLSQTPTAPDFGTAPEPPPVAPPAFEPPSTGTGLGADGPVSPTVSLPPSTGFDAPGPDFDAGLGSSSIDPASAAPIGGPPIGGPPSFDLGSEPGPSAPSAFSLDDAPAETPSKPDHPVSFAPEAVDSPPSSFGKPSFDEPSFDVSPAEAPSFSAGSDAFSPTTEPPPAETPAPPEIDSFDAPAPPSFDAAGGAPTSFAAEEPGPKSFSLDDEPWSLPVEQAPAAPAPDHPESFAAFEGFEEPAESPATTPSAGPSFGPPLGAPPSEPASPAEPTFSPPSLGDDSFPGSFAFEPFEPARAPEAFSPDPFATDAERAPSQPAAPQPATPQPAAPQPATPPAAEATVPEPFSPEPAPQPAAPQADPFADTGYDPHPTDFTSAFSMPPKDPGEDSTDRLQEALDGVLQIRGERGAPPPPEHEGTPFGDYRLLERIAVGGMAEVWRARRRGVEGFQKNVAIKKILSHLTGSSDFVTMFIDEAKLAAQLNHANIIQIYDLGKVDEDFFIAMELVDGKDLRSILNRAAELGRPIPPGLALTIVAALARALDYAHRKRDFDNRDLGLVHRDVSPQNVLISYEGEIKLCDFGIVKAVAKASTTQMGALKGKLQYMSPEQAWGKEVDARSDIFSLGSVLFEVLTGERLFTGDSEIGVLDAVRDCRVRAPRELEPDLPPEVDRITLKALAKTPEERYQTAGDLERDILAVLESLKPSPGQGDLAGYLESLFRSPHATTAIDTGAVTESHPTSTPSGGSEAAPPPAEAEKKAADKKTPSKSRAKTLLILGILLAALATIGFILLTLGGGDTPETPSPAPQPAATSVPPVTAPSEADGSAQDAAGTGSGEAAGTGSGEEGVTEGAADGSADAQSLDMKGLVDEALASERERLEASFEAERKRLEEELKKVKENPDS